MKAFFLLLMVAAVGCSNESGFSGEGQKSSPKPATQANVGTADNQPQVEPPKELPKPDPVPQVQDVPPSIPAQPIPPTAITKGSFSVWTDPSNPKPRENYHIKISVKLPSNTSGYVYSDLSGSVTGSDGYKRGIGRDSKGPGFFTNMLFPGEKDQFSADSSSATVSLFVPGAESLVRDIIVVSSDLLSESQTIEVVFGGFALMGAAE